MQQAMAERPTQVCAFIKSFPYPDVDSSLKYLVVVIIKLKNDKPTDTKKYFMSGTINYS